MKRYLYLLLIFAVVAPSVISCGEEELNPESIIAIEHETQNDFDKWLEANYVDPYNILVKYRYEMDEAGYTYWTIPASLDNSIIMAHLVKYICIDTYDEVAGIEFTRKYFPKMFFYTGEWEYKNNGTFILGTAEGGKKIFLAGLNYLPKYITSITDLNHYYLKTIHHEFTHILNQTKDFPSEYRQVTPTNYINDDWNEDDFEDYYRQRGFISAYSQDSPREDFAEMLSLYITNSVEKWEEWMELAGRKVTAEDVDNTECHISFPDLKEGDNFPGDVLINTKLGIVRKYMSSTFGIDIDELRSVVLRRQNEVIAGSVDLTSLSVE